MTPEDQAIVDLWDSEGAIETAIATVFTANGMETATPATISLFQNKRPRVDLICKIGSAQPNGNRVILASGTQITGAYKATVGAIILTSSEEASKLIHREYRAKIRWIMAQIGALVNGAILTTHKIQWAVETGTTLVTKPEEGFWNSGIEFAIDFSQQADALKALTIPTTTTP